MRIKNRCPHCDHEMHIRSTRQDHPLMKTIYFQCININCGATFSASQEIIRQLSPSAVPKSSILQQLQVHSS